VTAQDGDRSPPQPTVVWPRLPLRLHWQPTDRHPVLAAVGLPPVDLHGPLHYLGVMDPLCGMTRGTVAVLRGRPLVLNVWASWCIPCRKEMPAFQSVYLRAGGTVGFLGVDYLDQESAARRLVADTGVTYPLAADPKGTEVAKLGVTALPTTLFFSADGVLRGRRFGELNADRLRAAIRSYLGLEVP